MIFRVTEKAITQGPFHPNALAVAALSFEYAAVWHEKWLFSVSPHHFKSLPHRNVQEVHPKDFKSARAFVSEG